MMAYDCPEKIAYNNHRQRAKRSGIPFEFSLSEWISWWEENLGSEWMKLRGCRSGQYVMARNGDVGPYARWNVRAVTCEQNNSEARHLTRENHYWAKMTSSKVIEARKLYVPFCTKFGLKSLSRKYGISYGAMQKILHGKSWRGPDLGIIHSLVSR